MVIGSGFVAKRVVSRLARKVGFSDSTAAKLGSIAKWTTAVATFDVAGVLVDALVESSVEELVERAVEDSAEAVVDRGARNLVPRGARNLVSLINGSEESEPDDVETGEGATDQMDEYCTEYEQNCPSLGDEDTQGYESEGDEEENVEDAFDVLEEILPYLEMAKAAYEDTSMSLSCDIVERSQNIKNVIDPSRLFGVGTTDTEVHVCILEDESAAFVFRGTEPVDFECPFGDILTDLSRSQSTVKLYNGSDTPAYTAPSRIKAHAGFQLALKDVTDTNIPTQNLRLVLQGLGMETGDVRSVFCIGHSLGGAVATLCAKWCREVAFPDAQIRCVTMGSPRVGNLAFALDFDMRVVDAGSYRVVNKRDVVPCVPHLLTYPKRCSPYKHVSQAIYLCEDETTGNLCSRRGGSRPTWCNLGFFDHPGKAYIDSVKEILSA